MSRELTAEELAMFEQAGFDVEDAVVLSMAEMQEFLFEEGFLPGDEERSVVTGELNAATEAALHEWNEETGARFELDIASQEVIVRREDLEGGLGAVGWVAIGGVMFVGALLLARALIK